MFHILAQVPHLPLHWITNCGLPPIVSIPLFQAHDITLNILIHYSVNVATIIYLFLAHLLSVLFYLVILNIIAIILFHLVVAQPS